MRQRPFPEPPQVSPQEAKYALFVPAFTEPVGWYANKEDAKMARLNMEWVLNPSAGRPKVKRLSLLRG